ncbi:hypothetical protein KBC03_05985 [Patescibacteria group bacterium]|nr:hypothetical protein [Patescibacteria group bacterium]
MKEILIQIGNCETLLAVIHAIKRHPDLFKDGTREEWLLRAYGVKKYGAKAMNEDPEDIFLQDSGAKIPAEERDGVVLIVNKKQVIKLKTAIYSDYSSNNEVYAKVTEVGEMMKSLGQLT